MDDSSQELAHRICDITNGMEVTEAINGVMSALVSIMACNLDEEQRDFVSMQVTAMLDQELNNASIELKRRSH